MSRVDGINQLRQIINVDNNAVVCQAAKTSNGHTIVGLVTPNDAWTKELIVSSSSVFGYQLKCGDHDGSPMSGLNANMKMNLVDLGTGAGSLAIQFVKAKTFGIMTNYGTLSLPATVNGHLIVFFWPNDSPGDHWNHFINILNEGQKVTGAIAGIAENVVKIGESGAKFAGMFGTQAA